MAAPAWAGAAIGTRLGIRGLAIGDFNEDLHADVAVANSLNNNVSVLLAGCGTPQASGVVLTAPQAKAVENAARDAGFLVNAAAADVVRLAPPLVITDAQIDAFLTALPTVLDTAAGESK